jgi:prepilin-type N-terminal cleavage/methylation domain-containing protein
MRTQRGFTLMEVSVVIGVVAILLGLATINLVRSQQGVSLTSAEEVLVADLRQQQLKSMIGDTEGRSAPDPYGIHFDSNNYVLFHGLTYTPSDTSNFVINLDNNMQFNTPNFDVIFSRISGETLATIIELQDNTNSKSKKIYLNSLGVVTQVE